MAKQTPGKSPKSGVDVGGVVLSPWFESDWYLKIYGDFVERGSNPVRHYLEEGVSDLASPGPYFDAAWYVSRHGDAESVRKNPLQHYLAHAGTAGYEPNPLGATPADAQEPAEASALFDAEFYLDQYADVRAAEVDPVWHYLEAGRFEGRKPNPFFDPAYYLRQHTGVSMADALGHYVLNARSEGSDPNPYFASAWYAQKYLGGAADISPLQHYLEEGYRLGCQPHPLFDEARYLALNPPVANLVREGALRSGFYHFIHWGVDELERGQYRHFSFPWGGHELDYDRANYATDNPDVAQAIASGRVRNGIEHLFAFGWREAMDGLRALYGKRHQVKLIKSVAGRAARGGRYLCLFAHYDRDGLIDPYVLIYLKSLRAMDVDIVFITAAADAKELAKVKLLVSRILIKNEAGRDFGSWWLALKTLGLDCGQGYERVIFANDSIYFPVRPVAPLFADMDVKAFNFYGLSDSREQEQYHLQSFFLAFDAKAQEVMFPEFTARYERHYAASKMTQIREFEYGLTCLAKGAGLSVGAYLAVDDLREVLLHNPEFRSYAPIVRMGLGSVNAIHDVWDVAIAHAGWPGLKVELLRDNPRGASRLDMVPDFIADGAVPYEVIEKHQKRMRTPVPLRVAPAVSVESVRVDVRERIAGKGPDGRRLVLFAHYDPDGVVDDHVVHQIKALTQNDCAVAVITPSTRREELAKFVPYARDVIVKTNAGRDFGSWDLGIREYGDRLHAYDSVIWMNDSTYFPLFDLKPMFDMMDAGDNDFWGIVDSNNVTWHVMSWFWSFNRKIIKDGWFDWYLREHNAAYSKWAQIHNYEMRIPRMLRAAGYTAGTYVSSERVSELILVPEALAPGEASLREPMPVFTGGIREKERTLRRPMRHPKAAAARSGAFNMMHDFWQEVVVDLGCPAVKVELVRDNPLGIDLSTLLDVIGKHTDYNPDLIRRHMTRLKTAHLSPPAWADLGQPTARDS